MNENKILSVTENGVCTVTINNPESLNALNSIVIKELGKVFDDIAQDNDIKVVIITGAGRAFVAGADISEMSAMNPAQAKEFGFKGSSLFRKIEKFPIPVIAAVNGFALGGGCELAISCDIRVASEKAKFGQPEVSLGIIPGFSGTVRLQKIVGIAVAKELIFTGRIVDSEEASRIGLVNFVVPAEELMTKANEIASKIAANAPQAVRLAKESINLSSETDTDSGVGIESNMFGLCFSTEDQKEGMEAFLAKRKPDFKNK
jgi:enoyl-CoA hydratase